MRKITLLLIVFFIAFIARSQPLKTVAYYDWSSSTTFQLSSSPLVKGFGYYSDSLSKAYDGKTFYEYNSEYYLIESWADYYYWYTKKYWYKFKEPQLYEYYYLAKDNLGMASYIAGNYYQEYYYPSLIYIDFGKLSVKENRLSNTRYLALNTKDINKLNNCLKTDTDPRIKHNNNQKPINYKRSTSTANTYKPLSSFKTNPGGKINTTYSRTNNSNNSKTNEISTNPIKRTN